LKSMGMRGMCPPKKYCWEKIPGGPIVMSKTAARQICAPYMDDPDFVIGLRKQLEEDPHAH
jgi:hypothetical protein